MGRQVLGVLMALLLAAGAGQALAQGKSDEAAVKKEAAAEKTPAEKEADKAAAKAAKKEKKFAACMKNAQTDEARDACKKKYEKATKAQGEMKSQTRESKDKKP